MVIWTFSRASVRAAFRPPKPAPIMTTRGVLLLLIRPAYKIRAMAVGSKIFPQDSAPGPVTVSKPWDTSAIRSRSADWLEVLFVFAIFEGILWTPRSFGHSVMIAMVVVCVTWFSFRRNSRAELGLTWPAEGAGWILAVGVLAAIAIPAGIIATGHPV